MKRYGFTLIEQLVTIVIILVLLGIGAGVGSQMSRGAERDMTRSALESLSTISIEMQALGMPIAGATLDTTAEIVLKAKQTRSLKSMLQGIPENLLGKDSNNNGVIDNSELTVYDAWGNVIYFNPTGNLTPSGGTLPPRADGMFYFVEENTGTVVLQGGNLKGSIETENVIIDLA